MKEAGLLYSVAFSPDGQTVLTGSENQGARLWDAATGKPLSQPLWNGRWVMSVAFSPNGRKLLTGCNDGTIWKWDASPQRLPDNLQLVETWAKARTGKVLDDQRTPRRLSQAEWLEAQDELEKLRGDLELP